MSTISRTLIAAALALPIVACSSQASSGDKEARARDATANAIGGAAADQIVISQLEAGAVKWTWKAEAGGKTYACDADELLRLPDCREIG
jgi:hypothetical protein